MDLDDYSAYSSTDRALVFGTSDGGSIPSRRTLHASSFLLE